MKRKSKGAPRKLTRERIQNEGLTALEAIGIALANRRAALGITVEFASELTGINPRTLAKIERGQKPYPIDYFLVYCEAMSLCMTLKGTALKPEKINAIRKRIEAEKKEGMR